MTPDSELLAAFARDRSEDAFAELVRRHVNLVYSAALRQVNGDAYLAQDVAQTVFTDLALKAESLSRRESLSGWLYTSAHFAAAKAVRAEGRRRDREERFMREPTHEAGPGTDWEQIRPALDAAMHDLTEADREAILLRYFENRAFAELGAKLGLNENAARMRVERALEKLRAIFSRRNIATSAALASVISANAAQVAPAHLVAALTTASLATAGTGTFTLLKIMTAAQIKLGISAIVVAAAATAMVLQHQIQTQLRHQVDSLTRQIAQLKADNADMSNHLTKAVPAAPMPDAQMQELLKLRGEVGILRKQVGQLAQLRDENSRLQTALADAVNGRLHAPRGPTTTSSPTEAYRFATVNAAKQIGLAMRIFSGDNNNQYATNLNDIIDDVGTTNFSGGVKLGDFELVNVGYASLYHPAMIMLRQKSPIQGPDGMWYRIYGLADGSVQTAESPDGNFETWENRNTEMPPQNQTQAAGQ